MLGTIDGFALGSKEFEGSALGSRLGLELGPTLFTRDGNLLGMFLGTREVLGAIEGFALGPELLEGSTLGS